MDVLDLAPLDKPLVECTSCARVERCHELTQSSYSIFSRAILNFSCKSFRRLDASFDDLAFFSQISSSNAKIRSWSS